MTQYYVSPGNTVGEGTQASPTSLADWETRFRTKMNPADELCLNDGDYVRSAALVISRSGKTGQPIKIRSVNPFGARIMGPEIGKQFLNQALLFALVEARGDFIEITDVWFYGGPKNCVELSGSDCKVETCLMEWYGYSRTDNLNGGLAVSIAGTAKRGKVINNVMRYGKDHGPYDNNNTGTVPKSTVISGNDISYIGYKYGGLDSSGNPKLLTDANGELVLANNGAGGAAIQINGVGATGGISNAVVTDNYIHHSSNRGLLCMQAFNGTFTGNIICGCGGDAVSFALGSTGTVSNNQIASDARACIRVESIGKYGVSSISLTSNILICVNNALPNVPLAYQDVSAFSSSGTNTFISPSGVAADFNSTAKSLSEYQALFNDGTSTLDTAGIPAGLSQHIIDWLGATVVGSGSGNTDPLPDPNPSALVQSVSDSSGRRLEN